MRTWQLRATLVQLGLRPRLAGQPAGGRDVRLLLRQHLRPGQDDCQGSACATGLDYHDRGRAVSERCFQRGAQHARLTVVQRVPPSVGPAVPAAPPAHARTLPGASRTHLTYKLGRTWPGEAGASCLPLWPGMAAG